ncbi:MAG: PHP domain-containing protein [Clostridia bacterium]|nr:PHP domain-containing protein [Clostridia bacterium]
MTETNVQKQIGAYISQYKYKIEMHAHSYPASGCSKLSPKEFIRALKSAGYDAVVLTNHFSVVDPFVRSEDDLRVYMQNFKDVQAEGEKEGITVIFGAELWFDRNDYLVYGIDEAFMKELLAVKPQTYEAFYEAFRSPNRLIMQAHPHRDTCRFMDASLMDGMELNYNPNEEAGVTHAGLYIRNNHIPIVVAGSDLHEDKQLNACALRARTLPADGAELVSLLKSKDYILEVGGVPMFPYHHF